MTGTTWPGIGTPTDLRGRYLWRRRLRHGRIWRPGRWAVGASVPLRRQNLLPWDAEFAAFHIGEGRFVGGYHAGAGAGFNRHVADGHALFH